MAKRSKSNPYYSVDEYGKEYKTPAQKKAMRDFLKGLGIRDENISEILKMPRKAFLEICKMSQVKLTRNIIDGVREVAPTEYIDPEDLEGSYGCFATQTPNGKVHYWITDDRGDRIIVSKKYLEEKEIKLPIPFPIFKDRFPILVLNIFEKRGEGVEAYLFYCRDEEYLREKLLEIPASDYEESQDPFVDINMAKLLMEGSVEISDCFLQVIGWYGPYEEEEQPIPQNDDYYAFIAGPIFGWSVEHFQTKEEANRYLRNAMYGDSESFSSDSEDEDLIFYILAKWCDGPNKNDLHTIHSGVKGEWKDYFSK